MKNRPRLPGSPLPNHTASPSLEAANNLSDREQSALKIANLFRQISASAAAHGVMCRSDPRKREMERIAAAGVERIEGLLKEIEKETEKL